MLEKKHTQLYAKLGSIEEAAPREYETVYSRAALPSLKVSKGGEQYFLHSKYDPVKEAQRFAEEYYEPDVNSYIIYGFAFAYHIQEILKKGPKINIYIFEANGFIFKEALKNVNLVEILSHPNIRIYLEEEPEKFARKFHDILAIENSKLVIHLPSLKAMPENFIEIKRLFENYRIEDNTVNNYKDILDYNFKQNINNYNKNVDILFGKFENMPIIIISAGPSLDKNKHLLKEAENKAVILAVGTAVKPLLSSGICPDLIIITDPHEIVYDQLEGIDIDIPIIVLSTCSHKVMKNYKGFKLMALQHGFGPAEDYARGMNNVMVRTGGSVATTALDVALNMKCNPIIFVGQDLAYTDGQTHASGAHLCKEIRDTSSLRSIAGQDGNTVYTSKNLYIYLKWIEKKIQEEENTVFLNATEGGAFIKGTKNVTLKEVLDIYLSNNNYNFADIINKSIDWSVKRQ
ncbi:MAG: DUF115 domain-containing protein [Clostridia bacterium]|nr:DUF115 domain-containing protein [Clostridia bacterium]